MRDVPAPDQPSSDGFAAACRALGSTAPDPALHAAAQDLRARWGEPHRGYHDLEHLAEVLDHLTELDARTPAAVLAAWFHDAVYAGSAGDDELASAVLATSVLNRLGVRAAGTDRVHELVLATAEHEADPGDPERQALLDADLAVLASHPDRYARYVAGVRREHRHLDDAEFSAGRLAVLRRLVARDPLFGTARGRQRWERAARANVRREIDGLLGPAPAD